jgi:hypothetical protein
VVTKSSAAKIAAAQSPRPGELNLDHVAHFVPHLDHAVPALEKLGFTLTPFSAQSHRLEPGGPLVPAGTGNRCAMFKRGYLECLTPTGDTQAANQLHAAIKRYVGVHLIAFGTSAPDLDHTRLLTQGFAPIEPVALQRQIATPHGEDTARFTVVRVPPGTMAEGRIQFCQHHTPQLVWQPQWLTHANRAAALTAVVLCVENPEDAAARYARFTGLKAAGAGDNWHLDAQRGRLLFSTPAVIKRVFNAEPPELPWIAGYVLASDNMAATRKHIAATGFAHGDLDQRRLYVVPPQSVGGIIVFEPKAGTALEFGMHAA